MGNDVIRYRDALLEEIETKINYLEAEKNEYFKRNDYEQGNIVVEKIGTAREIVNIINRLRLE